MRGWTTVWCAVTLAVVPAGDANAAGCWEPPVVAPIADPFRAPPCPWCPGNRGIEYDTPAGVTIRAVSGGVVSFAGRVAGTGYVVVELVDGRRVTYGNLADVPVGRGDVVVTGQRLGITDGSFHFGVRVGDDYVDPARWIGEPRYRLRLLPVDGSDPPPPPPPTWTCAG